LIVKQAIFTYVNHVRFRSWNKPAMRVKFIAQGNNGILWWDI